MWIFFLLYTVVGQIFGPAILPIRLHFLRFGFLIDGRNLSKKLREAWIRIWLEKLIFCHQLNRPPNLYKDGIVLGIICFSEKSVWKNNLYNTEGIFLKMALMYSLVEKSLQCVFWHPREISTVCSAMKSLFEWPIHCLFFRWVAFLYFHRAEVAFSSSSAEWDLFHLSLLI